MAYEESAGLHQEQSRSRCTLAVKAQPFDSIWCRVSFAKTSSAFSFNNLGKPDITCSNSQYENYAVWCSFAIWQSYTSKINKI
jgi:hypothetical protein